MSESSSLKIEGFYKEYWHLPDLKRNGLALLNNGSPMGSKRAYGFEVSYKEKDRKDFFMNYAFQSHRVEVLESLAYKEVQDYPGHSTPSWVMFLTKSTN